MRQAGGAVDWHQRSWGRRAHQDIFALGSKPSCKYGLGVAEAGKIGESGGRRASVGEWGLNISSHSSSATHRATLSVAAPHSPATGVCEPRPTERGPARSCLSQPTKVLSPAEAGSSSTSFGLLAGSLAALTLARSSRRLPEGSSSPFPPRLSSSAAIPCVHRFATWYIARTDSTTCGQICGFAGKNFARIRFDGEKKAVSCIFELNMFSAKGLCGGYSTLEEDFNRSGRDLVCFGSSRAAHTRRQAPARPGRALASGCALSSGAPCHCPRVRCWARAQRRSQRENPCSRARPATGCGQNGAASRSRLCR